MSLLPTLDIDFTILIGGPPPDLPFLGPTVRGLLGYGLRQSCCGHEADDAGRCPMGDACAYSFLFEGPPQCRMRDDGLELDALPQPFIPLVPPPFERRASGQRMTFGVRLIGTATTLAAEVARAIVARQRVGFGARSHGYSLESIEVAGAAAWLRARDPAGDSIEEQVRHHATRATQHESPLDALAVDLSAQREGTLHIELHTPLSLAGSVPEADQWAARLLDAAARRKWLLERAYGVGWQSARGIPRTIGDAGRFRTTQVQVTPFRVERRSTRHGRVVCLQGDLGTLAIQGPWHHHTALLQSMARYGVGQSTSFGFGRVGLRLRIDQSQASPAATRPRSEVPRWVRLRGAPPTRPPSVR